MDENDKPNETPDPAEEKQELDTTPTAGLIRPGEAESYVEDDPRTLAERLRDIANEVEGRKDIAIASSSTNMFNPDDYHIRVSKAEHDVGRTRHYNIILTSNKGDGSHGISINIDSIDPAAEQAVAALIDWLYGKGGATPAPTPVSLPRGEDE